MDILRFGFKYYKKNIPLALVALIMGFCLIGIGLLMPQISEIIIDFIIIPHDSSYASATQSSSLFNFMLSGKYGDIGSMELMLNISLLSILLMFIKHILLYTRNNLHLVYGFKYEKLLKKMTFQKMLDSSNAVISRYNTGELMTILSNDTTLFRDLFMKTIPNTLDSIFMIILSILFLFNIYPALALLPFTVLPFQLFIFIRYLKKAHQINSQIRDSQSNLSMNVQENINGVRIVRSFAAENYEKKKFDKSSSLFKNMYFKQADFVTKYGFGFNFLRHSLYMISIAAGSVLAIQGKIGIGAFLAFITYVFTILDATTNIINYMFEFQLYLVSGERIMTFIETGNIIDNSDNPKTITFPPNIKVENINLTIDGQIILKNVCINIPYGKKLGIMGNTSSGKTSLLKILSRFVDPVYGSIIINGINLKDIELEQVRKIYSYVMQDVFLFSNTVDSNIALYDMDMPFEKVENCAKLSEANDFIIKMQDGYDTVIGERGIGLSGGQKQRISIARALAKDAPVLLLDDVTSALDTETEKTLLKNIYTNYPEKTVIITAHRATSVKDCDEIIYLNNGEIAERGTHKELLELNGRYAKIYKEQSSKNIGE